MTERKKALEILLNIYTKKTYSNLELAGRLKGMDFRGKALVTNIVYGVLQNGIHIDHILKHYLKSPVSKTDMTVLTILRMGVYQIMYMDKIPDYAIVNESIRLAVKEGKGFAKGMINAVLRGILRNDKKITYPEDETERLGIIYSHPKWICDMWLKDFPDKAAELIKAGNTKPPFTLRANTLKITAEALAEKLGGRRGDLSRDSVILEKGMDVAEDKLYYDGFYYPQDEASMLAVQLLDPREGETVIDMCGAPGGKATHIAQLMKNKGKITAFDIYDHKLQLINTTAARLGITIVEARLQDGCEYCDKYENSADRVLVDAPCSGLGILRRKPEIKYERSKEDIKALQKIQYKILCNGAKYLKQGGILVYSTCTVSKAENADMIKKFLENQDGFALEEERQLFTSKNGTDGFYMAKIKKCEV